MLNYVEPWSAFHNQPFRAISGEVNFIVPRASLCQGSPSLSALASREVSEPNWWGNRLGRDCAGLALGGLSQQTGRQGGPSPHMPGEMVQECFSSPRPGPCPPHPGSCSHGPSSLNSGSTDGRCLQFCLVDLARGLQKQPGPGDWPRDGQVQATEPQGAGVWPEASPAHWVMWPASTPEVPGLCNKELNVVVLGDR